VCIQTFETLVLKDVVPADLHSLKLEQLPMVELDNLTASWQWFEILVSSSIVSLFSDWLDDFLRGMDASIQDIVWCGDAPGLHGVFPSLVMQLNLFCSLGSVPLLAMIGWHHSLCLLIG
jgi:hypothetical protein